MAPFVDAAEQLLRGGGSCSHEHEELELMLACMLQTADPDGPLT